VTGVPTGGIARRSKISESDVKRSNSGNVQSIKSGDSTAAFAHKKIVACNDATGCKATEGWTEHAAKQSVRGAERKTEEPRKKQTPKVYPDCGPVSIRCIRVLQGRNVGGGKGG